jgi:type II secretory pathway component GspD/PulD (secretin)
MGGMGMGGMGSGMGMGGMGTGGMGGMGMGGMGGMSGMGGMGGMGGMMGGMGGMGMMGGGMGGMGMMGGGMGNMQGMSMAYGLRQLIEESVNPDSWLDISTQQNALGQITIFPQQSPQKMAIYNTAEAHKQINDLLDQLRKALGHEVSIEARFLVVSENFLEHIGLDLDWTYNAGGKVGTITFNQDSFTSAAPDVSTRVPGSLGALADNPAVSVAGGYGTVLDDLQVSLLLHATQARTDTKALSAPKVTVMSGEGASFTIYDTVAYALPPTTTTTTAVGGVGAGVVGTSAYNNISAMQVGSQLSITPTITKDKKYVLLNIVSQQIDLLRLRTLQVTQPNPNTAAGAPATVTTPVTVPETETSNVATRVSVPDRGTLLLGGHKLTAKVDKEVGVPILGKIPILGRLFSNRSTIRDEKILLILVKPTIILQEEAEHEAIAAMEEQGAAPRP